MVTETEEDAALRAILDQNIGVGNRPWDDKLDRRCVGKMVPIVQCYPVGSAAN